jgi:hypothetical protein
MLSGSITLPSSAGYGSSLFSVELSFIKSLLWHQIGAASRSEVAQRTAEVTGILYPPTPPLQCYKR